MGLDTKIQDNRRLDSFTNFLLLESRPYPLLIIGYHDINLEFIQFFDISFLQNILRCFPGMSGMWR